MKKITYVTIYLDDDMPEYMLGVHRCGSVISEDEDGETKDHQELIDNSEFHSLLDMRKYISEKLKVDIDIVEIET